MKKTYFALMGITIAFTFLWLNSCKFEFFRNGDPIGTYLTDTLTHSSFDFSASEIPADYNQADGETINWCPDGQNPNYANNTQWIWWRTSDFNTEFQKDYGTVELSSITSIPVTWDNIINPLIDGHCYVVSCNDGFAKFKVISTGFHDWDVEVEYEYSANNDFK